jgi:hypothetical protein
VHLILALPRWLSDDPIAWEGFSMRNLVTAAFAAMMLAAFI